MVQGPRNGGGEEQEAKTEAAGGRQREAGAGQDHERSEHERVSFRA